MAMKFKLMILIGVSVIAISGCMPSVPRPDGKPAEYSDPRMSGEIDGIGMESQDIIGMTDKMMRDMLANPRLSSSERPLKVIIDAEYFYNESSTRVDKNMITDRLRVNLNRAAKGRMVFVGRHYSDMVEKERQLKRQGVVSGGRSYSEQTYGADYRLGGRITTVDSVKVTTGMASRFTQIIFEMVDLETAEVVWSGMYDFKKTGQDDVIYR